jgi:hypothetical protein
MMFARWTACHRQAGFTNNYRALPDGGASFAGALDPGLSANNRDRIQNTMPVGEDKAQDA